MLPDSLEISIKTMSEKSGVKARLTLTLYHKVTNDGISRRLYIHYNCDRIWENPAYRHNAQVTLCVFLAAQVVQFLSHSCQRTFLLTIAVPYGG